MSQHRHELKRTDSGVVCASSPVESLLSNTQNMDFPRQRPNTLHETKTKHWVPVLNNLEIDGVYYNEDISRKAEEIVNQVLSSPNQESDIQRVCQDLFTITEQETTSPTSECEYPISQELLHPLNADYLTVGADEKYFPSRDYYLNDVSQLGQGGFGTCLFASDNATNRKFVLKRNNKNEEDKIQSVKAESATLSTLYHDNIVFFYGAVLDTYPSNFRRCNMMMELADNGSLLELLKGEDNALVPLDIDQSLYYLEQILQGLFYLHDRSVMHLDIKSANVLVFNSGRTVKLADFGTAASSAGLSSGTYKLEGVSPLYAAPEIVRQEYPRFASDVWSAHCVFVELITGKQPWCYNECTCIGNYHEAIFKVGNYDDNIEDIVPVKELSLECEVLDLFISVFKKDWTERPTALGLLSKPRLLQARNYRKYLDDYINENEAEDLMNTSCNRTLQKISVTSNMSISEDSGVGYSRKVSSVSADSANSHFLEGQNNLPSPGVQSFTLGTHNSHSAPCSISSHPRRRLSLGINPTHQGAGIEQDIAGKYKAVQRSISFSETYAERGPETDPPVPNHCGSAPYPVSRAQSTKLGHKPLQNLITQLDQLPQSQSDIKSSQSDQFVTLADQSNQCMEHSQFRGSNGAAPKSFKDIV